MRSFLRQLGFEFEDVQLDPIIQLFAAAQQRRLQASLAETKEVTRSTAIVALAQIAPQIALSLKAAGLKWEAFREAIGLPGDISPAGVGDVDLHQDFETAIKRFAEGHPNLRDPTPLALATAIIEMVRRDPPTSVLRQRFERFGVANIESLPTAWGREQRRVAWMCQYRPGDRVTAWTKDARAGSIIMWKTEQKSLPHGMQPGDPLIYWRTIHPRDKQDRGGLVGTGHVVSTELQEFEGGYRFQTGSKNSLRKRQSRAMMLSNLLRCSARFGEVQFLTLHPIKR